MYMLCISLFLCQLWLLDAFTVVPSRVSPSETLLAPNPWHHRGSYASRSLRLSSSSSTSAATTTTSFSPLNTPLPSNKLLHAVLAQPQASQQDIDELVQKLVANPATPWTYDPTESIYGPLYYTLVAYTPNDPSQAPPLWERLSFKADNRKGQQYTQRTEQDPPDIAGTLINYAEIWGSDVHLRATGTCVPVDKDVQQEESTAASNGSKKNFSNLFAPIKPTTWSKKNATLRTCPDDYVATVTGASLHVGPNLMWKLPIEGSSIQRILYADPQLRIFTSPGASDSVVGAWEESGLVVVQVRSDLVTDNHKAIDLR